MNVLFLDTGTPSTGSSRIWTHHLAKLMGNEGVRVFINDRESLEHAHVVLLGKSTGLDIFDDTIQREAKPVIGVINPSDYTPERKTAALRADFLLVGSQEERDYYLQYNRNVFIFPLIEDIATQPKQHVQTSEVTLGYHGNLHHLNQFFPHITRAIEAVAREIPLKMIALYNIGQEGLWKKGRPSIPIQDVQWDLGSFPAALMASDIGIVPGLAPCEGLRGRLAKWITGARREWKYGAFRTDYIIRFKNNSNAGRAFVFHQLGIPVISDFMPSCFHILADPDCGCLAHGEKGWEYAIRKLALSHRSRQEMAQNAKKRFNELYDPQIWTQRLLVSLNDLLSDQQSSRVTTSG